MKAPFPLHIDGHIFVIPEEEIRTNSVQHKCKNRDSHRSCSVKVFLNILQM